MSLAVSHGIVYMLDSAGGLSQLDSANKYAFSALPIQIPSPLKPAAPEDYSVATPVPTPQPTPVKPRRGPDTQRRHERIAATRRIGRAHRHTCGDRDARSP